MWLPTQDQINAASRHAITAAGVAVTIFGLQAKGVSMENVTDLINSLGTAIGGLVQLIAAAGMLYGGIKAVQKASPTSQVASVQAIAKSAAPVSTDAKNALIAATISLPEVQTIVADKATADASPSPSVVAATR